jgi:fructokinase
VFAGIAGSGTRFECVVGTGPGDVHETAAFPTTTPEETLDLVTRYLLRFGRLDAVGIACFGPLDLRRGRITSTLKNGWRDCDIAGVVRSVVPAPVGLDTDVNSAAIAERALGAARGCDDIVFVTIGAGIGAGALVAGRPVHGRAHPEMGHLPVTRHPSDPLAGRCPHHGDCLEALATATAIADRNLPGDAATRLAAWYLAQLTVALTYVLSPERIVVDCDVLALPGLLPALRAATRDRLADDPAVAAITSDVGEYLVPSALDGRAALLGTLALAETVVTDGKDGRSG